MSEVSFADFKKCDLRVAKILEVYEIPGADRIWKLLVDVGLEKKEIVAGVKSFYSREQLLGRSIIILNNLSPAVIRGTESRGMLLAASSKSAPATGSEAMPTTGKEETRLCLLGLEHDLPPGSSVG